MPDELENTSIGRVCASAGIRGIYIGINCIPVHNSIRWFLPVYTSEALWNPYYLHQSGTGFDEMNKTVETQDFASLQGLLFL